MGFKPITRNMPAEEPPNILSGDDAAIYRGILGQDGVLNIGSKLKSTVLSSNKVRVGDGVINVDGHIGRNAYADYEDLTIENGTAGQKRNDLIIASFSTTGSGGLDTYVLKVKKGVAGSTGTDPAVTKQDIYAGGKLREYPLYRVKLDGLSIVGVEQLFKVIPTVPELETKYNELNSALQDYIIMITWESPRFSLNGHEWKDFSEQFRPDFPKGYTEAWCLGGNPNGSPVVICNNNGWIVNATPLPANDITVTYQWLFAKTKNNVVL